MARSVAELVCHRLNPEASVLSGEAFNPLPVITIEDNVLGTTNNEPVDVKDFGSRQMALRSSKFRKADVGLCAGKPDIRDDANG